MSLVTALFLLFAILCSSAFGFTQYQQTPITTRTQTTSLYASLKPAAIPLMDSGKALARSGELLIDLTSSLDLYGGALSAAGAQIRNSGDSIAQAAASCRFKAGSELVCDELREGATCLTEATDKMKLAVEEAQADKNEALAQKIENMVGTMQSAGEILEAAGACIMRGRPVAELGINLVECGKGLQTISLQVAELAPEQNDGKLSSQRMAYAAEKMIEAGNELQGAPKPKPKGKGWLKQ